MTEYGVQPRQPDGEAIQTAEPDTLPVVSSRTTGHIVIRGNKPRRRRSGGEDNSSESGTSSDEADTRSTGPVSRSGRPGRRRSPVRSGPRSGRRRKERRGCAEDRPMMMRPVPEGEPAQVNEDKGWPAAKSMRSVHPVEEAIPNERGATDRSD